MQFDYCINSHAGGVTGGVGHGDFDFKKSLPHHHVFYSFYKKLLLQVFRVVMRDFLAKYFSQSSFKYYIEQSRAGDLESLTQSLTFLNRIQTRLFRALKYSKCCELRFIWLDGHKLGRFGIFRSYFLLLLLFL